MPISCPSTPEIPILPGRRYLINVGNPTSLLFLVGIMRLGALEGSVAEPDELQPESLDELAVDEPERRVYGQG
jgi:hypothetical protein